VLVAFSSLRLVKTYDLIMPEFLGPGDQHAVAADLLAFRRLGAGDDRSIKHDPVFDPLPPSHRFL
jgi:hypothetical protein